MSLALHDLMICCRGLENDKVTERKVVCLLCVYRSPNTMSTTIHESFSCQWD